MLTYPSKVRSFGCIHALNKFGSFVCKSRKWSFYFKEPLHKPPKVSCKPDKAFHSVTLSGQGQYLITFTFLGSTETPTLEITCSKNVTFRAKIHTLLTSRITSVFEEIATSLEGVLHAFCHFENRPICR